MLSRYANGLALMLQERFKAYGYDETTSLDYKKDINFILAGSKVLNSFPICTMQQVDETMSDWIRKRDGIRYKKVETTFQFNYITKKALEDSRFMNDFIDYLNGDNLGEGTLKPDFKYCTYKVGTETINNDIEYVKSETSNVRDMTIIENGTTLYCKSVDVTFSCLVGSNDVPTPIEKVQGIAQAIDGNTVLYEQEIITEKE